jgi:hypothetical protein
LPLITPLDPCPTRLLLDLTVMPSTPALSLYFVLVLAGPRRLPDGQIWVVILTRRQRR